MNHRMKYPGICFLFLTLVAGPAFDAPALGDSRDHRLVIHEWGTFTVLQDESGSPIPGVNINEESLPDFVNVLSPTLSPDTHALGPLFNDRLYQGLPRRSKGIARFDPAVTMRMETPIVYFHLPEGKPEPRELDVEIAFRHGWISEWYPDADISAPGFVPMRNSQPITSETTGRIAWKGITVGETGGTPADTKEHVWLAPRQVASDPVSTAKGQTERYLFYRGVANMEAPLRVLRSKDGNSLTIVPNASMGGDIGDMAFPYLWLADIREDGTTAFRVVPGMTLEASNENRARTTAGRFEKGDYSRDNLVTLRASMREAAMADGLYSDEADALLNTWEVSYFKTSGLRLFFLVPEAWTESVLPMNVSEPAAMERVMIGRIELVTPEQRQLLNRMAAVPAHDKKWFYEPFERMTTDEQIQTRNDLLSGKRTLEECGFDTPECYSDYMALGRFRDALVVDGIRRGRGNGLAMFAQVYGLNYFKSW